MHTKEQLVIQPHNHSTVNSFYEKFQSHGSKLILTEEELQCLMAWSLINLLNLYACVRWVKHIHITDNYLNNWNIGLKQHNHFKLATHRWFMEISEMHSSNLYGQKSNLVNYVRYYHNLKKNIYNFLSFYQKQSKQLEYLLGNWLNIFIIINKINNKTTRICFTIQ